MFNGESIENKANLTGRHFKSNHYVLKNNKLEARSVPLIKATNYQWIPTSRINKPEKDDYYTQTVKRLQTQLKQANSKLHSYQSPNGLKSPKDSNLTASKADLRSPVHDNYQKLIDTIRKKEEQLSQRDQQIQKMKSTISVFELKERKHKQDLYQKEKIIDEQKKQIEGLRQRARSMNVTPLNTDRTQRYQPGRYTQRQPFVESTFVPVLPSINQKTEQKKPLSFNPNRKYRQNDLQSSVKKEEPFKESVSHSNQPFASNLKSRDESDYSPSNVSHLSNLSPAQRQYFQRYNQVMKNLGLKVGAQHVLSPDVNPRGNSQGYLPSLSNLSNAQSVTFGSGNSDFHPSFKATSLAKLNPVQVKEAPHYLDEIKEQPETIKKTKTDDSNTTESTSHPLFKKDNPFTALRNQMKTFQDQAPVPPAPTKNLNINTSNENADTKNQPYLPSQQFMKNTRTTNQFPDQSGATTNQSGLFRTDFRSQPSHDYKFNTGLDSRYPPPGDFRYQPKNDHRNSSGAQFSGANKFYQTHNTKPSFKSWATEGLKQPDLSFKSQTQWGLDSNIRSYANQLGSKYREDDKNKFGLDSQKRINYKPQIDSMTGGYRNLASKFPWKQA